MPVSRRQLSREFTREAVRKTREIYMDLAQRPIERYCVGRAVCCHFSLTGKIPSVTRGEALVMWAAIRASGRKRLPESTDGACPLLNPQTKRCLIYDGRPFGCRTHFCAAAGGPYERREVLDLIRRLEVIDAESGGDGPKPLENALRGVE
ncbi:MAG TPA: YkgJ family cysteine cluster protein [Chthoniobacterales bacterium]